MKCFYICRCESEINECDSSPCQNNATCIDELDGYQCNCSANYTGIHCEFEVSCPGGVERVGDEYGLVWVGRDELDWYQCNCTTNYTGIHSVFEVSCPGGVERVGDEYGLVWVGRDELGRVPVQLYRKLYRHP